MSVTAGKDLNAVYDTSGYLSKLILTAYALDDLFHETLRDIYKIDITTGKSADGSIVYGAGPVKAEERVKAKAQSDYASRPSPCTSCVIGELSLSLSLSFFLRICEILRVQLFCFFFFEQKTNRFHSLRDDL